MSFVPLRTVQTHPKEIDDELAQNNGRPVIVTRNGHPIWAIMPVNEDTLYDHILASAPEYTRQMDEVDEAIAEGTFLEILATAIFGLAAGLCIGALIAANFAMFELEEKEHEQAEQRVEAHAKA